MLIIPAILAIFTALLQTSLIPSISIFGGFYDLCLIVLLIFLFFGSVRQASLFFLISAITLTVLSGIPIIFLILPNFILMIGYLFLSSRRVISRPSGFLSPLYFFAASFMVGLIKIILTQQFFIRLILPIATGSVLTAAVGGIIYWLCLKIYFFLNPQILHEKIKISHL